MGALNTTRNLAAPDDVYDLLIHAHEGKTPAESHAFNARLILILMNHIGDKDAIAEALALAEA